MSIFTATNYKTKYKLYQKYENMNINTYILHKIYK